MRRDRPRPTLLGTWKAALALGCLLALPSRPLLAQAHPALETKPTMAAKRIVLCLDGTWNSTYDESKRDDGTKVLKPTNVLKLCRSVLPVGLEHRQQLAYYEIGVGSLAEYPGTSNRLLYRADKYLGGVWGAGFESNIENALNFLVLNHQEGDSIFIFGFSRGAATARGLTHFLDWAGGLPRKEDAYYLPGLFRAYVVAQGKGSGAEVVAGINKERAPRPPLAPFQAVDVEFLGVWDTVMALGSRFKATGTSTSSVSKSFYLSAQPARCVKNARQALGIDEERYDFRPEIWTGAAPGQTLEQRWFPGVHSNVGGGYVHDGLANDAFQWILKEAVGKGLEVDKKFPSFYRGFSQDELYTSSSFFYRAFDWARSGKGKRSLLRQPPTANLSLDPAVIRRIKSDPKDFPKLQKPYRPENVLLFLACQPDVDSYLAGLGLDAEHRQLPPDVVQTIEKLRPRCAKEGRKPS